VYSWAVLVWEMLAGCRAWAALNYGQVINAVAIEGRSLQVAPAPPAPAFPPRCGVACSIAARPSAPRPFRALRMPRAASGLLHLWSSVLQ